jgi:hypothetical protein
MACDITVYVEKRINNKWRIIDCDVFSNRNYSFFAWLAGVRNYSCVKPLASGRGLPSDFSLAHDVFSDYHSLSWVSVDELLDVNYESIIEDRRVDGSSTCDAGCGKFVKLRDFLGEGYFNDLKILKELKADRVIFMFDN